MCTSSTERCASNTIHSDDSNDPWSIILASRRQDNKILVRRRIDANRWSAASSGKSYLQIIRQCFFQLDLG
jgi:hypothetical protein